MTRALARGHDACVLDTERARDLADRAGETAALPRIPVMAECVGTHRQGYVWACALLALVCAAPPASAQSAVGGIVKDANGRVVVGAQVTVTELISRRERQTQSSPIGSYELARLPPGAYALRVESKDYEPFIAQVELVRHHMARLDVALQVRHSEYITVRGDTGSPAPLTTTDLSIGTTFSRDAVETLPHTNGRTVQSMLLLVPGIVFTDAVGTPAQFTATGQRRSSNRMTVDGMSTEFAVDVAGRGIGQAGSGAFPALATSGGTQTLVPVGAIEEIQVRTTNASPEFARTPGAQTAVVTRAGGDRFAGRAVAALRPQALAAADWFSNAGLQPKRDVQFWNAGASAGGPIVPRRLQFFLTWEQQAIRRPVDITVPVPSLAIRQEATGLARATLDAFPRPNGAELGDDLAEYSGSRPASSDLRTLSVRLDATLAARHRLFARGNWGESWGDALAIGSQVPMYMFDDRERAETMTGTVGLTSAFSSVTHDLRVNVSTHRGSLIAGPASLEGAGPLPSQLVPSGAASSDSQLVLFLFPGDSGFIADGRLGAGSQRQVQILDTWSLLRGRHEWRAGLEYRRLIASSRPSPASYQYRFTGVRQFVDGGLPFMTVQSRLPARALLESWALYAQDAFRVSPRLSVNYGLRYSVRRPPASLNDIEPLLVRFETLPQVELLPSGSTAWHTSWTDISPRVAAAYQLSAEDGRETVLRAGWSLTFDELTAPGASAFGLGYPYTALRYGNPSTFPATEGALPLSMPPPFSPGTQAEYYAFPRDLRSPRTQHWQVGVDRSLGQVHRIALGYVGAAGRDLIYAPSYYPQAPSQAHVIRAFSNDARSDYHALLAEFVRRWSRGLSARAAYTWSHAIDTDSGEAVSPLPPPAVVSPRANRGAADFDRRHVLQFLVSFRLPTTSSRNWLRAACSAWQLDLVGTMRSAAPVNLIAGRDLDIGWYDLRPDVVPNVPLWLTDPSSPGGRRLNPEAFRVPVEQRQGTLGRNGLRAFPLRQIDLSLSRSKRFGERIEAQLRLDAFNLFNTPAFGPPYEYTATPEFGRPRQSYAGAMGAGTLVGGGLAPIQQVGGPRSIQLGLRVAF